MGRAVRILYLVLGSLINKHGLPWKDATLSVASYFSVGFPRADKVVPLNFVLRHLTGFSKAIATMAIPELDLQECLLPLSPVERLGHLYRFKFLESC